MTNKVVTPVNMEALLSEADKLPVRNGSISEASQQSQTAAEYVKTTSARS